MKITKQYLKQVIKEELQRMVQESTVDVDSNPEAYVQVVKKIKPLNGQQFFQNWANGSYMSGGGAFNLKSIDAINELASMLGIKGVQQDEKGRSFLQADNNEKQKLKFLPGFAYKH